MTLAKPISSLMTTSSPSSKFEGLTITNPTLYHNIMGSLQYLSITRPNLSFLVNKVSQFMQEPQESHGTAVKCILRHLKLKSDHTFSIYYSSLTQLTAYSDSDRAGCMIDAQCLDIVPFLFEIYSHGVRKRRQPFQGPAQNLSTKL